MIFKQKFDKFYVALNSSVKIMSRHVTFAMVDFQNYCWRNIWKLVEKAGKSFHAGCAAFILGETTG